MPIGKKTPAPFLLKSELQRSVSQKQTEPEALISSSSIVRQPWVWKSPDGAQFFMYIVFPSPISKNDFIIHFI